jgi:hypothetical protein
VVQAPKLPEQGAKTRQVRWVRPRNPQLPWERQVRESAQAYEAVELYFSQGGQRSPEAVARALGRSLSQVLGWFEDQDWEGRAAAYDAAGKSASPRGSGPEGGEGTGDTAVAAVTLAGAAEPICEGGSEGPDPAGSPSPPAPEGPAAVEDPWPARRAALREREWAASSLLQDLGEAILRRSGPSGSVGDALRLLRQASEMGQRAVAMAPPAGAGKPPADPHFEAVLSDPLEDEDPFADEDGPWQNVESPRGDADNMTLLDYID